MKKYYLIVLSIILNSTLSLAECDLNSKINKASSEYLSGGFMNAIYMFADSKEVIAKGAKGIYSNATKQKLQADQQMPIASATKTMTAAGILKLQDKNLLNVNDPIAKYLDEKSGIWTDNKIPEWANKVTIHNLLTHRSGVPEYFMALNIDVSKPHVEINKDIANFTKDISFTPGEKHHYCNTNYVLLGLLIEQVSGTDLGQFYKKEFFEPLGLNDTKLITLAEGVQQQTNPETMNYPERYFVTPSGASEPYFNPAQSRFLMVPFSDGGVVSTTQDLIKWHQAIHAGKVLSAESYNLMTTRHYEVKGWHGVHNYMGYGLYISELANGDVLYQHAGKAVAIRSESGCIPKKDLCFAVLSNVMDYIPKEMEGKIDIKRPENQLDIQHYLAHIFKAI